VNILDCALPPKQNKLKKLVSDKAKTQGFSEETINAFKRFAHFLDKANADMTFLIGVYALFEPNSEIF
jgi:hypothetical protein